MSTKLSLVGPSSCDWLSICCYVRPRPQTDQNFSAHTIVKVESILSHLFFSAQFLVKYKVHIGHLRLKLPIKQTLNAVCLLDSVPVMHYGNE